MDSTLAIGVAGVVAAQVATVITLLINGRNARLRDEAVVKNLAAKAERDDQRAERDRRWLIQDREALANTLEKKVVATADTLALKLAADNAAVAALTRAHVTELSDAARKDQAHLTATVESATTTATDKVADLTALIIGVGDDAKAAYHEANGAKLLIAETNAVLADEVHKRNELESRNQTAQRRSTDDPPSDGLRLK